MTRSRTWKPSPRRPGTSGTMPALASDHAPDGVVESPMFATVQGRSAIEASWRTLFTAFPDLQITIDAVLIDPPRVALFSTAQATHVNEFFGIPGTHKRFEIHHVF